VPAPWDTHLSAEERGRVDGLLSPADQERLARLVQEPAAHVDDLRGDPAFQAAVARADVLPRLLGWFTALPGRGTDGWVHDPDRSGPLGPASVAVEWSFAGTYPETRFDRQGDVLGEAANTRFNGVRGVGQQVEVHGISLLGVEDGVFRVRRYIDWAGVYAQLGLSLTWRTPHGAARRRG
jgi:hypothetical protein